eukprot:3962560-Pleurochrysis_carterae.AAC.1
MFVRHARRTRAQSVLSGGEDLKGTFGSEAMTRDRRWRRGEKRKRMRRGERRQKRHDPHWRACPF